GPSHLVSVVNSSIDVIDKADGTLLSQQSLNDFFAPDSPTGELFDAKVLYDQFHDRFVVTAVETVGTDTADTSDDVSRIHVAASTTDDPTGSWDFLAIDALSATSDLGNTWADAPGLGVSSDALYVTTVQRDFATGDMADSRLFIIKNDPTTWGDPDPFTANDPDPASSSLIFEPAHMYGTPSDNKLGTYLVAAGAEDGSGNDLLRVVRVDDPIGTPAFTPTYVDLGGDVFDASASLPGAPQPGTSTTIDTGDLRIASVVWRNDQLWAVHTIDPLSGDDVGQATV